MKTILGELQCAVDQRFGSIDLSRDRVSRDVSKLVGLGAYGVVYEGMLHPEQIKVAVKTVRYGDKSDLNVLKASRFFAFVSAMPHDNILESS